MSGAWVDIAGHSLGAPHEVIAIQSREDLARALSLAREQGRPFAAVGLRASYWHNLSIEGAIVADLQAFDRVVQCDEEGGVITVESGIPLRALDRELRTRGHQLVMHPDSFGDTFVGSAIANGTTAGMGMMNHSFLDQIVGLELLLTDGRFVQLGASRATGKPGHGVARGLPDLRSLWFGSEGALGVITHVDVALFPARWEAHLEYRVDDDRAGEVLALAARWRRRGLLDTIRWEWDGSGTLGLFLSSPLDAEDLERRIERASAELVAWPSPGIVRFGSDYRRGQAPEYETKWRGPPGETWRRAGRAPMFGIDGILPYSRAATAYEWARSVQVPGAEHLRVALYFGSDGVNLGIHGVTSADRRMAAREALEARIPELVRFDAIPYRPGLVWITSFLGRVDPVTRSVLGSVAGLLDPRATMNPGVGLLARQEPSEKES